MNTTEDDIKKLKLEVNRLSTESKKQLVEINQLKTKVRTLGGLISKVNAIESKLNKWGK